MSLLRFDFQDVFRIEADGGVSFDSYRPFIRSGRRMNASSATNEFVFAAKSGFEGPRRSNLTTR